jgi:hypothetical protein
MEKDDFESNNKRIKSDDLDQFLDWCNNMDIYINYDKVCF